MTFKNLTEDDKDILAALGDSQYYAPLQKLLELHTQAVAERALKCFEKEQLWNARLEFEGANKLTRDVLAAIREMSKGRR